MGYRADTDAMRTLAARLARQADSLEGTTGAAVALCRGEGRGWEEAMVARTGTVVAEWARRWSASVAERASILDGGDFFDAGGVVPGLRHAWALAETWGGDFAAWHRLVDPVRRGEIARGRALARRLGSGDILRHGDELAEELGGMAPHALAALFEELEAARVHEILRWTSPPDPMAPAIGMRLGDAFAIALGTAWTAGELSAGFRTELIDTGWEAPFYAFARSGDAFPAEFVGMLTAKVVGESPRTDLARNPGNAAFTRSEALAVLGAVTRSDPEAARAFAAFPRWLSRPAGDDGEELEEWVAPLLEATLDPSDAEIMASLIRFVAAHGVEEPALRRLVASWTEGPVALDLLGEANKARQVGGDRLAGTLVDLGRLPLTATEARDFLDVMVADAAVAGSLHTAIWDHAGAVLSDSAARPGGGGLMADVPRLAGLVSLYAGSATRLAADSAAAAQARRDRLRQVNIYLSQSLNLMTTTPPGTVARGALSLGVWLVGEGIAGGDVDAAAVEEDAWITRLDERHCLEMLLLLEIAEHAGSNGLLPDHLFPDPTLYDSYEAWRDPVSNHDPIEDYVDEIRDNWNPGPGGDG